MRVLCIGDLHCREIWKDIVSKEGNSCDKIIFLGDYTCPKEVKFNDPTDACGFLYEVLNFKDQYPEKVILLRGNHDCASLGYYWARCWPQDHAKVQEYWQTNDVKNWFLKNTQWIYLIPDTNIVCSHAGISEKFFENVKKHWILNIDQSLVPGIVDINKIEPCELFAFTPCKLSDYSGESATQPCTWIRPYTLLQYGIEGITQVVGHTPIEHICNLKDEILKDREKYGFEKGEEIVNNYCDVWCCDNLANGEYLIIEDGKFKPCRL